MRESSALKVVMCLRVQGCATLLSFTDTHLQHSRLKQRKDGGQGCQVGSLRTACVTHCLLL